MEKIVKRLREGDKNEPVISPPPPPPVPQEFLIEIPIQPQEQANAVITPMDQMALVQSMMQNMQMMHNHMHQTYTTVHQGRGRGRGRGRGKDGCGRGRGRTHSGGGSYCHTHGKLQPFRSKFQNTRRKSQPGCYIKQHTGRKRNTLLLDHTKMIIWVRYS